MRRHVELKLLLIGLGLSVAGRASAEPEPRSSTVVVVTDPASPFFDAVVRDLRQGLAGKGVEVISGDEREGRKPDLARVRLLGAPNDAGYQVEVRVEDRVTDKSISKLVSIQGVREEDRALTLAIAIEELLRASWMELAMVERARAREAAPPVVARQIEEELRAAQPPRPGKPTMHAVEVHADARFLSGKIGTLGAGAGYTLWIHPRVGIGAQLDAARMLTFRTPSGEVSGTAVLPSLALALALLERPSFVELELRGYGTLGWLGLEPTSQVATAIAQPSSHLVGMAGGEVLARLELSESLHPFLGARLGGVLRGVEVQDQFRATSSSFLGVELGGRVGLALDLD